MPDTLETYLIVFSLEKTFVSMIYIVKERLFEEQSEVIRRTRKKATSPCTQDFRLVLENVDCGMVEPSGIEPLTSCVQGRRSPS